MFFNNDYTLFEVITTRHFQKQNILFSKNVMFANNNKLLNILLSKTHDTSTTDKGYLLL